MLLRSWGHDGGSLPDAPGLSRARGGRYTAGAIGLGARPACNRRYIEGMVRSLETFPQTDPPPSMDGPMIMDAVLSPHRSLSMPGFVVLMVVVMGMAGVTSAMYLLVGAWPVLGFFGLDVALIAGAFLWSYRQGRLRELVRVSPDHLWVTRHHPSGREEHFTLSPAWARVEWSSGGDPRAPLLVRSHGRALVLGGFLSPEERADFAGALKEALATAREVRHEPAAG